MVTRLDKYGYHIPKSWDQTKGERMNKKTAVSKNDKVVVAQGIIKQIKEQYTDWDAATRCKLFATLYTLALKEKKDIA